MYLCTYLRLRLLFERRSVYQEIDLNYGLITMIRLEPYQIRLLLWIR